jgi:VWFA-related protein
LFAATVAVVAQELPEILETVEVRVVNVDVVVSDADGRPVGDLNRDDFELLVNGREVAMDFFSSVVDGSTAGEVGEPANPAALPYLAIVCDGRGQRPTHARRAVDSLSDRLEELLERAQAVMVLRQGTSLVVEQAMTRDRERLHAALERLAAPRAPALGGGDRQLLLLQLESADPPRIAGDSEDDLVVQQARALLRQVRTQAEAERFAVAESARQLQSVVRSLAGLPGRKAILLLGEGFRQRPADALFRLWWSKFSGYASRLGIVGIEAEMGRVKNDHLLTALIDDANAHRVTFYSHDPAGLRAVGSSAEHASLETNLQLARETESTVDSLVDLALATGGVGDLRTVGMEQLLDEMLAGFGTYYSLGFAPEGPEGGRIRVRLRRPGLRLRYLKQFATRTTARQLEDATLATLITEVEDNPLQIGVELGEAERQEDGSFLVPVLVKVPVARLALLPRRARHVGKLSFVVIACTADGGLSRPATGEVPIEFANSELLSAMGRTAGYRLQLRMGAGEQTVAIGVRDEVAHEDATVRLALAPGRDV